MFCLLHTAQNIDTVCLRSIVNEVIMAILNFFIFFYKISHTESIKSTKSTKCQTSDFPPLRYFYAHKNAVFFVFIHLYAYYAFCVCEIFL